MRISFVLGGSSVVVLEDGLDERSEDLDESNRSANWKAMCGEFISFVSFFLFLFLFMSFFRFFMFRTRDKIDGLAKWVYDVMQRDEL